MPRLTTVFPMHQSNTRLRYFLIGLVVAGLLIAASATPGFGYPRPGLTDRISVNQVGLQGQRPVVGQVPGNLLDSFAECENAMGRVDITPNGRYAVFSTFLELDDGLVDTNQACDVFRKDLKTEAIVRVSVNSRSGSQAVSPSPSVDGPLLAQSSGPSISANGRFVAFASAASDLVEGDTNNAWDTFVRDIKKGTTQRVSVSSEGNQAMGQLATRPGHSWEPSISTNGRYVVFASTAPNLVEDDTVTKDVFVHDLKTHETRKVSVVPSDGALGGPFAGPSIDDSGRFVVFEGTARETAATGSRNVFVRDLVTNETTPISVETDGKTLGGGYAVAHSEWAGGGGHQISSDGRYVVFKSPLSGLVPNDANNPTGTAENNDVFVRDLATRRTERVSVNAYGEEPSFIVVCNPLCSRYGASSAAAISPDGRYVTFGHYSQTLSPNEVTNGDEDVYVHDRKTGALEWVSTDTEGGDRTDCSRAFAERIPVAHPGALDQGARTVAFTGYSPCLVANDSNDALDIFERHFGSDLGVGDLASPANLTARGNEGFAATGTMSHMDALDDVDPSLSAHGANIYGVTLTQRPDLGDLFGTIDLEEMPRVFPGVASPIFYGLRFDVQSKSYEVRATSLLGGTFGLFDCTDSLACKKVADLRGGYGTTGERVVFSLPLSQIGLEAGGELSDVEAFTALGSYLTGAVTVLDTLSLQ